jgi:hypothetical protein
MTFLAIVFHSFYFDFFNGVQNSVALYAQIYLITNNFRTRQAVGGSLVDFV